MVFPAIILWLSLLVDRLVGDPPNTLHPVAWLGRLIGWWGQPDRYPLSIQRAAGIFFAIFTATLFALPFFLYGQYMPPLALLIGGPVLLKICFAWRCLEEHVEDVREALEHGTAGGREQVSRLVSRDTTVLEREEILSAAYESMAENLVDSIISPLFYFTLFGLGGAAWFRAVNTMDAMLGYRDERERLGWGAARIDDLLNFIPARFAGLILLAYFALKGRFQPAYRTLKADARKRPGWNGGIPMAIIAGGVGIRFIKPGSYVIGNGTRSLADAGEEVVTVVRAATLIGAGILSFILVFITILFV